MKKKLLSNILGYTSLVCSLSCWVWLGYSAIAHVPQEIDLSLNSWAVIWVIGLILALVAALLGSKRWFWAAILPVLTIFMVLMIIAVYESQYDRR